jgi:hypothetical protein
MLVVTTVTFDFFAVGLIKESVESLSCFRLPLLLIDPAATTLALGQAYSMTLKLTWLEIGRFWEKQARWDAALLADVADEGREGWLLSTKLQLRHGLLSVQSRGRGRQCQPQQDWQRSKLCDRPSNRARLSPVPQRDQNPLVGCAPSQHCSFSVMVLNGEARQGAANLARARLSNK